jgi:hypothetical protein
VPILRASHFLPRRGEEKREVSVLSCLGSSVCWQLVAVLLKPRFAAPFKDISLLQGAARPRTLLALTPLPPPTRPLSSGDSNRTTLPSAFQGGLLKHGSSICCWSWLSTLSTSHRIRSYTGVRINTSKGLSRQLVQPKITARPLLHTNF